MLDDPPRACYHWVMTILENYLEIRSKTLAFEQDIIPLRNRFVAFLLKNDPWTYVDYNLRKWLEVEDAIPNMAQSNQAFILYQTSEMTGENSHFYMPVAFIDNPDKWESDTLAKMEKNSSIEGGSY